MNQKKIFGFTQNVFVLSLISFLNDIGGETIKRTLPLFLTNVLGAKAPIVGLIEGISDSTAQLSQPISGYFSDKLGKRKPFLVIGQIFRSFMVFFFAATSWWHVLIIRFLDRAGKGIANAPRDALLSESTPEGTKGRAFGLQRAFDNGGAVVGLLLASFLVFITTKNQLLLTEALFQKIVLFVVIPALLVFVLLAFFVSDVIPTRKEPSFHFSFRNLDSRFKLFLLLTFVFTLGNSSDAFLILKAQRAGLTLAGLFLLLALFSLVSSLVSLPAGIRSDHEGRKRLLVFGWILYSFIYLGFGLASFSWQIWILFLSYGAYYGLTEGVAKALVSDLVTPPMRGTAYGVYNFVVGFTLLPASLLAGFLWQWISPAALFFFGAILSLLATLGMVFFLHLHDGESLYGR